MSYHVETLDFGKSLFKVNGVDVIAQITVEVFYDADFQLDWDFLPGEKEKLEHEINRGELMPCTIQVKAKAEGLEGEDSLGACLIRNENDIKEIVIQHSMTQQACENLATNIQDTANRLIRFTKSL
jgi:hypothetical protein